MTFMDNHKICSLKLWAAPLLLCSCQRLESEDSQWFLALSALLVCHYLGDYCLTTKAMVKAKAECKNFFQIFLHAGVHAVLLSLVLWFFEVPLRGCFVAFLIELVSHFLIDTFKSAFSVMVEALRDNTRKPYWLLYGFDQLLHILVIVTLTFLYI